MGVLAVIIAYGFRYGQNAFLELLGYFAAAGGPMILACSAHHEQRERKDRESIRDAAREELR